MTAVIPYFSYAKGDKKDEPRVSIRARVCADAIEAAACDRVVTMDLHAPQIQGFFHIPVDDLYAMPMLCEAIRTMDLTDLVVVVARRRVRQEGPDVRQAARRADGDRGQASAIDHTETAEVIELIGDVAGKTALIVDDFTISAGTLVEVADCLIDRGARVGLRDGHPRRLLRRRDEAPRGQPDRAAAASPTASRPNRSSCPARSQIVSVAPLFGEAIRRIHQRESVSVLFA